MLDFYVEQDLLIPREEFELRWQRARAMMKEAGIDVLLIYSDGYRYGNLRYMANYISPSLWRQGLMILEPEGQPVLMMDRESYMRRIKRFSPVEDIRFAHTPWHAGFAMLDGTIEVLKEKGLFDSKVAVAGLDIMSGIYCQYLEKTLPNGVINADWILERLRYIKSENEIELIRTATKRGEVVLMDGIKRAKIGDTELDIAADIRHDMIASGEYFCASLPFLYVQSGPETLFPLRQPYATGRELKAGDAFFVDLAMAYGGYVTDLTRSVFMGGVSSEQKNILDVVAEAQKACIAAVKPGNRACDVWEAGRQVMAKHGLEEGYAQAYSGHAIGTEIGEGPLLNRTDTTVLQENMVFAVEPALYFDDIGGIRIEDVVRVTADGSEKLSSIDQFVW